MVFCVTVGLIAPGVVDASGSELCARAPLANRVARTKIAAAPDRIAACLLVAGALLLSAPAKGYRGSTVREPRHNAKCGSCRLCATPAPSGGSPPPANHPRRRKMRRGPRRAADHREILPPTTIFGSRPTHPSSEPVDRPELV